MEKIPQLGSLLAQGRQKKQLSLEALSQKSRVSVEVLRKFEAGDFSVLPPAYIIPMLKLIAREIGVEESEVDDYKAHFASTPLSGTSVVSPATDYPDNDRNLLNDTSDQVWWESFLDQKFLLVGGVVVMVSLAGFLSWKFVFSGEPEIIRYSAPPTEISPLQRETLPKEVKEKPSLPVEGLEALPLKETEPISAVELGPKQDPVATVASLPASVQKPLETSPKEPKREQQKSLPEFSGDIMPLSSSRAASSESLPMPLQKPIESSESKSLDAQSKSPQKPNSPKYKVTIYLNQDVTDSTLITLSDGITSRFIRLSSSNKTARVESDTEMKITVDRVESISLLVNEIPVLLPKSEGPLTNFVITKED